MLYDTHQNKKYFLLPINTGYVENELPNKRCMDFYSQRSDNGLYCSIIGNVLTPNGKVSNARCSRISKSIIWSRLAKTIESKGAKPGIQLSSAWHGYSGMKQFVCKNKSQARFEYSSIIDKLNSNDVESCFSDLMAGIKLSMDAGFKHIQIHAGHGYLFSLLIDPFFSKHSELAFEQLLKVCNESLANGAEISLRFSYITGDDEVDLNRRFLIDKILSLPCTFFDVSFGYYNFNKNLIYPTNEDDLLYRRYSTINLAKRFPDKQIILSGKSNGAWDLTLPKNVHIGICRDLIANPNFLLNRTIKCTNCNKCHYYSRGDLHLTCGSWE